MLGNKPLPPPPLAELQTQLAAARREIARITEQRDILKNVGHSLRTVAERYERIDAMKNDCSILALCANLDVSPSGYHAWHQRRTCPGPRAVANQALAQEIRQIHTQSWQTYGRPRLFAALRQQGHRHGRHRVARLMKAAGLCGRQKGRYTASRPLTASTTSPSRPTVWPSSQGQRPQPALGGHVADLRPAQLPSAQAPLRRRESGDGTRRDCD